MKTFNNFIEEGKYTPHQGSKEKAKRAKKQPGFGKPLSGKPVGVATGPTQAMKDKAARERNAARITRPATAARGGSPKGGPLATIPKPKTRPNNPTRAQVKPKSDNMETRNKKMLDAGKKTFDKRKSGIRSGLKSALGGDIIGAKPREGEGRGEKVARLKSQKAARTDLGKKVVDGAKKELRDVFRLPKQREVGVSQGGGLTGPKTRSSGGGAQ